MHRSWLEVSLGQIAGNFRAVRAVVGQDVTQDGTQDGTQDVTVMPFVKADAYRHGAVERVQDRYRSAAVTDEYVALFEELCIDRG